MTPTQHLRQPGPARARLVAVAAAELKMRASICGDRGDALARAVIDRVLDAVDADDASPGSQRQLAIAVDALEAIEDERRTSMRWRASTSGQGAEKPNVRNVASRALTKIKGA